MVIRYLAWLLAITSVVCLCIGLSIGLTAPFPDYAVDTATWAASGHIANTFAPQAYPLFLGPAFRLAGNHGVIALQAVLQVAIAAVSFLLLLELGLPPIWSAFGSLPIAFHPDLLASVVKIWDVPLSTFLLLLLTLLCLCLHRRPRTTLPLLTVGIGVVFAADIFCRPNYAVLLPIIFFSFYRLRPALSIGAVCGYLAACIAVACSTFALLGVASHGSAFFPRNGPYNLYAGHNPHTINALLTQLNAESSIPAAYLESNPGASLPALYSPSLNHFYIHQSIRFAREHPGTELVLLPVKLLTLFRPDTKVHRLLSASGIIKGVLALPVFLVLAMLLLPQRIPLRFNFNDRFLFCIEAAYILPFLITNSDPRLRIPLDALLLLHFVSLLYRRLSPMPIAA